MNRTLVDPLLEYLTNRFFSLIKFLGSPGGYQLNTFGKSILLVCVFVAFMGDIPNVVQKVVRFTRAISSLFFSLQEILEGLFGPGKNHSKPKNTCRILIIVALLQLVGLVRPHYT
jgi:hypothetical protein